MLVCVMLVTDSVQDGATALYMASQNGHCEVVETLLEAKADVNMKANVSESCSRDGLGEYMFTCGFCYNYRMEPQHYMWPVRMVI